MKQSVQPTTVVPVEKRARASVELARKTDHLARRLSRYDDPGAGMENFDESMVYSGIAHTLAFWWRDLPDHEIEARIADFAGRLRQSRAALIEEKEKSADADHWKNITATKQ